MSNKMSVEEYKREINRVHSPRKTRPIRKNNTKTKIRMQTVQKVSGVQGVCASSLFEGPFRIEVEIYGKCRADGSNILKGIEDALNGYAYKDDKQAIEGRFIRKD